MLCRPMQPRDDSEDQQKFREARNALIAKWIEKGMLQYSLVWSRHSNDNKIAMCTEAMDTIGWSVFMFDGRMEDHVAAMRNKIKRRKLKRRQSSEYSSDEDGSTTASCQTPAKKKPEPDKSPEEQPDKESKIKNYATRARVSLIDAKDRVMAHGVITDDEPSIPQNEDDLAANDRWTKAHSELRSNLNNKKSS